MNYTREDFLKLCKTVLESGKELKFKVSGASMLPVLRDEDQVYIRQVPLTEFKPGDLLFYHTPDSKVVVHRVLKITGEKFWLKGDFNPFFDTPCHPGNILGKIIRAERQGKPIPTHISPLRLAVHYYGANLRHGLTFIYKYLRHRVLGKLGQALQATPPWRWMARGFHSPGDFSYCGYVPEALGALVNFYHRTSPFQSRAALREFISMKLLPQTPRDLMLLGYYKKKKLVGLIRIKACGTSALVEEWTVAWRYRGSGVGTALLRQAVANLTEISGSRIKLEFRGPLNPVSRAIVQQCLKDGSFDCSAAPGENEV